MRKGFTLIELLVTVGLFAIVISIAVGGFTSAIRTQRQVSALISAESNISLSLEQMARQVRTGYLFCSSYGNTNPQIGNGPSAVADCGCSLSAAPGAPSGSWTCNSLEFYDAGSNLIFYTVRNGALMEGMNSTTTLQSVTGNAVTVKDMRFQIFGQTETDHWTPRVTVSLQLAPSSTDPSILSDVFNIQTTVSARTIDCYTQSGTTSC
jgi:prepilin-type N-terminal cleavage/methylation domain-containing protein